MLNIELPYDPAIPFLGRQKGEMKTNVPTKTHEQMLIAASFASQQVEITHMPINDEWIKKLEWWNTIPQ